MIRHRQPELNSQLTALSRDETAARKLLSDNPGAVGEFNKQQARITRALIKLFETYGYLSENMIGVNVKQDTLLLSPAFFKTIELTRLIPHEDGSIEVATTNAFHQYIQAAMASGKLDRMVYNELGTVESGAALAERIAFPPGRIVDNTLQLNLSFLTLNELSQIEQTRLRYGLCNFEGYILKLKYQAQHTADPFIFSEKIAEPISAIYGRDWITFAL